MGKDRYVINRSVCDLSSGGLYEGMDHEAHQKVLLNRLDIEAGFEGERLVDLIKSIVQRGGHFSGEKVLPILDGGEDEDGFFLVMGHFRGTPMLRAYPEAMSEGEFVNFAEQALEGLEEIHSKGYVHGAITPESFLVRLVYGRDSKYTIADSFLSELLPFIEQEAGESSLPVHPALVAPEMFSGGSPTSRSDIYMLGQTFYYLLLGAHPFVEMDMDEIKMRHEQHLMYSLQEIDSTIPTWISDMVDRMTSASPDDRFQEVGDIVGFMQSACGKNV